MTRYRQKFLTVTLALLGTSSIAQEAAFALRAGVAGKAEAFAYFDDIRADSGLAMPAVHAATVPDMPVVAAVEGAVEVGDFQLALTQLAIHIGANDHLQILEAQGAASDALYVSAGSYPSLAALFAATSAAGLSILRQEGETYHLARPLIIWPGASVAIAPGETLEMDTAGGAMVVSLGLLTVQSATVTGSATANSGDPEFHPFLVSAGTGTISARGSVFTNLGIAGNDRYGGVAVVSRGLYRPTETTQFTNNHFTDVAALFVEGGSGAAITDNTFDGTIAGSIIVVGGDGITVSGNMLDAPVRTGIMVGTAATQVSVLGNVVLGGQGNGIAVDSNAAAVQVSGNLLAGLSGTGLALDRAACVAVIDNVIAANFGSGMRADTSAPLLVNGNAFFWNDAAGLRITQQPSAPIRIGGNAIAGNRYGLDGRGMAEVVLADNDFSGQLPRLFENEAAQFLAPYLETTQVKGEPEFLIKVGLASMSNDPAVLPASTDCSWE